MVRKRFNCTGNIGYEPYWLTRNHQRIWDKSWWNIKVGMSVFKKQCWSDPEVIKLTEYSVTVSGVSIIVSPLKRLLNYLRTNSQEVVQNTAEGEKHLMPQWSCMQKRWGQRLKRNTKNFLAAASWWRQLSLRL